MSNAIDNRNGLVSLEPEEAVHTYLDDIRDEKAGATVYSHRSRLGHFIRWTKQNDVDEMAALNRKHLQLYKVWRRDDGNLNKVSLKTQMDTFRVFIRWCEDFGAVQDNLHEHVRSPTLSHGENQRSVMLEIDEGNAINEWLREYKNGSKEHALFELLWSTGMRIGAAHGLDINDYYPDKQYAEINHRPETETPIKNKEDGERHISLPSSVCDALDAYLDNPRRPDVEDNYGRKPMFTSRKGRLHKTTLRTLIYGITRPCVYIGECPHDDVDPEVCPAENSKNEASKCPSTVSPHAIRRGALTRQLRNEIEKHKVSDRANVGIDTIDKHYNEMTEEEKMDQRRDPFDDEYDDV